MTERELMGTSDWTEEEGLTRDKSEMKRQGWEKASLCMQEGTVFRQRSLGRGREDEGVSWRSSTCWAAVEESSLVKLEGDALKSMTRRRYFSQIK